MQHAGVQYGQGVPLSHHHASDQYTSSDVQTHGANTTSALRQWRKKEPGEKPAGGETALENQGPIARVAPHTHYPRPPSDIYRYPHQYADYTSPFKETAPTPVKYSEIVEPPSLQRLDHKAKEKEYLEMCAIQHPHLKQYQEQLGLKQQYGSAQYPPKDPTLHYVPKESQMHGYATQKEQYPQYFPKYNVQPQYQRPYADTSNNFLAHLNKINPQMAQAIINDPHLGDPHSQLPMYHSLDQNRATYHQNQRLYRPPAMHNNPAFPQRQNYNHQNYNFKLQASGPGPDPYRLQQQYQQGAPKYPIEQPLRNTSPRRGYQDNLAFNYMPKVSPPNYQPCSQLEYAQHYQHRRPPAHVQPDYYQQKSGFMEPELADACATKSNSLKQYLESWNDEEMTTNLNEMPVSNSRLDLDKIPIIKGHIRVKDDGSEQQLYVFDSTEISSENLTQLLHMQIDKLPENFKGFYSSESGLVHNQPELPPKNVNYPPSGVLEENTTNNNINVPQIDDLKQRAEECMNLPELAETETERKLSVICDNSLAATSCLYDKSIDDAINLSKPLCGEETKPKTSEESTTVPNISGKIETQEEGKKGAKEATCIVKNQSEVTKEADSDNHAVTDVKQEKTLQDRNKESLPEVVQDTSKNISIESNIDNDTSSESSIDSAIVKYIDDTIDSHNDSSIDNHIDNSIENIDDKLVDIPGNKLDSNPSADPPNVNQQNSAADSLNVNQQNSTGTEDRSITIDDFKNKPEPDDSLESPATEKPEVETDDASISVEKVAKSTKTVGTETELPSREDVAMQTSEDDLSSSQVEESESSDGKEESTGEETLSGTSPGKVLLEIEDEILEINVFYVENRKVISIKPMSDVIVLAENYTSEVSEAEKLLEDVDQTNLESGAENDETAEEGDEETKQTNELIAQDETGDTETVAAAENADVTETPQDFENNSQELKETENDDQLSESVTCSETSCVEASPLEETTNPIVETEINADSEENRRELSTINAQALEEYVAVDKLGNCDYIEVDLQLDVQNEEIIESNSEEDENTAEIVPITNDENYLKKLETKHQEAEKAQKRKIDKICESLQQKMALNRKYPDLKEIKIVVEDIVQMGKYKNLNVHESKPERKVETRKIEPKVAAKVEAKSETTVASENRTKKRIETERRARVNNQKNYKRIILQKDVLKKRIFLNKGTNRQNDHSTCDEKPETLDDTKINNKSSTERKRKSSILGETKEKIEDKPKQATTRKVEETKTKTDEVPTKILKSSKPNEKIPPRNSTLKEDHKLNGQRKQAHNYHHHQTISSRVAKLNSHWNKEGSLLIKTPAQKKLYRDFHSSNPHKRRLSLEEYNIRKRKHSSSSSSEHDRTPTRGTQKGEAKEQKKHGDGGKPVEDELVEVVSAKISEQIQKESATERPTSRRLSEKNPPLPLQEKRINHERVRRNSATNSSKSQHFNEDPRRIQEKPQKNAQLQDPRVSQERLDKLQLSSKDNQQVVQEKLHTKSVILEDPRLSQEKDKHCNTRNLDKPHGVLEDPRLKQERPLLTHQATQKLDKPHVVLEDPRLVRQQTKPIEDVPGCEERFFPTTCDKHPVTHEKSIFVQKKAHHSFPYPISERNKCYPVGEKPYNVHEKPHLIRETPYPVHEKLYVVQEKPRLVQEKTYFVRDNLCPVQERHFQEKVRLQVKSKQYEKHGSREDKSGLASRERGGSFSGKGLARREKGVVQEKRSVQVQEENLEEKSVVQDKQIGQNLSFSGGQEECVLQGLVGDKNLMTGKNFMTQKTFVVQNDLVAQNDFVIQRELVGQNDVMTHKNLMAQKDLVIQKDLENSLRPHKSLLPEKGVVQYKMLVQENFLYHEKNVVKQKEVEEDCSEKVKERTDMETKLFAEESATKTQSFSPEQNQKDLLVDVVLRKKVETVVPTFSKEFEHIPKKEQDVKDNCHNIKAEEESEQCSNLKTKQEASTRSPNSHEAQKSDQKDNPPVPEQKLKTETIQEPKSSGSKDYDCSLTNNLLKKIEFKKHRKLSPPKLVVNIDELTLPQFENSKPLDTIELQLPKLTNKFINEEQSAFNRLENLELTTIEGPPSTSSSFFLRNREPISITLKRTSTVIARALDVFEDSSSVETENDLLMRRFLNRESLKADEVEKVKDIIKYKRALEVIKRKQRLHDATYEVAAQSENMKIHLRKVTDQRKRKRTKRFRNLYDDDDEDEQDENDSQTLQGIEEAAADDEGECHVDYSVHQSKSQAGVPKIIIKRKTNQLQPFVKLERRMSIDLMAMKRRRFS